MNIVKADIVMFIPQEMCCLITIGLTLSLTRPACCVSSSAKPDRIAPETFGQLSVDCNRELLHAARLLDSDRVIQMLNDGVDPNVVNSRGLNALHMTIIAAPDDYNAADLDENRFQQSQIIANRAEQIIKALLSANANYRHASSDGLTPALQAALMNKRRILQVLLPYSDPNSVIESGDRQGQSLLMICVQQDNAEAVSKLIARDAHLDLADAVGNTALMWACHLGRSAIVQILVDAGADVHACNLQGETALHLLARSRRSVADLIRVLIKSGAVVDSRDVHDNTPLICAASLGKIAEVEALIEFGADPNAANGSGRTPLMCTAASRACLLNIRLLQSYLEWSAKEPEQLHRDALRDISRRQVDQIQKQQRIATNLCSLLIHSGASVCAQDLDGNSAITLASEGNWSSVVEIMLSAWRVDCKSNASLIRALEVAKNRRDDEGAIIRTQIQRLISKTN